MTFSEKISKILNNNTLGINSPSGLEEFIGASTGAITKPLAKGIAAGPMIQKKIKEKLRINPDWWDTGKGEIYLPNGEYDKQYKEPVKVLPLDAWELLQDNNSEFKKEINRLWSLIDKNAKPHKAK